MYVGANKVEGDGFTIVLFGCDEDDEDDDGGDTVADIVEGITADDATDDDDTLDDGAVNGSVDETVAYIGGPWVWGDVVCDGPARSYVMP